MASDLIVSDGTGWVLASNGLSVSALRGWVSADEVRRQYPPRTTGAAEITDEEVAACEAWTFPPIHETATYEGDGDVRCRCGQWIGWLDDLPCDDDDDPSIVQCAYCGRRYRVRLEEVTDGE